MTKSRCTRCHRPLTSAQSIARGTGRTCARNTRRENVATNLTREFKGAETARRKALDLLADGALIPTRHDGQYLAVASDGVATYLVDTIERSCTCKGHQRVGRCYHLVAADTVELTTGSARTLALAA